MTIHYHGTPITPRRELLSLSGHCFCVSHSDGRDVEICHQIGQSVMLDNGAFSAWKAEKPTDWPAYYAWAERWLSYPTTWAVIPDEIDGGSQIQDALIREWPFGDRGAPVWHMDEPLDRLLRLVDEWPKVCIGSTRQFAIVLSPTWIRRMNEVWNELSRRRFLPWVHMLRGMQCSGLEWPFASVDSTDVARNHNRIQNCAATMATTWDARQCHRIWKNTPEQMELI
jgi:hypothetical protein